MEVTCGLNRNLSLSSGLRERKLSKAADYMIEVEIPGLKKLTLAHLVLDFNGTMAIDGILIEGVEHALNNLAQHLSIHILTTDPPGLAQGQIKKIAGTLHVLSPAGLAMARQRFVGDLGAERVVCIGTGRNDQLMLRTAALGMEITKGEGLTNRTCLPATIPCSSILDALSLLQNPKRLMATWPK